MLVIEVCICVLSIKTGPLRTDTNVQNWNCSLNSKSWILLFYSSFSCQLRRADVPLPLPDWEQDEVNWDTSAKFSLTSILRRTY